MTRFLPSINRKFATFDAKPTTLCRFLFLSCLLITITACSKRLTTSSMPFVVTYQKSKINCQRDFSHQNSNWHLQQLQFFIANVALKNKQGVWHSWLMKKNSYQSNNIALIGENCADNESNNSHWGIEFAEALNLQNFTDIRFTLGVPFEQNHLNPLTQASPLNDSSMFWVWQTGHKFMRLELANRKQKWLFHLGSTGCKSPSVMRTPKNECLHPNRVNVTLPLPKASVSALTLDLHTLLQDVVLNSQTFCQSSPDNPNCQGLLNALGLNETNNYVGKNSAVFQVITDE